ncbi:MAG TPA: protein kinase [Polyangiaceae bacterium LLY-WYZ-15_(1-7)]|nr:protein kinase [Polyangiaceae bacterium LLY-WYZ-15_(1-7)]HJL07393.1 protein kinase [Polyangiaceae bacterium LLY-WYZ-15_(1-7)]HJL23560.1 protein kinase [Polyangiaceae bacterium LLY-WYZ-15_(1-7)]
MTDSHQPSLAGTVVAGRYRIVRALGGGGMGTVYEVSHVALERPAALKVVRVGPQTDELVQRFQREARALARLRTPRVAQVTDFGVEPGLGPWYVMELVEGETLQHRLDRDGSIPAEEALPLFIALCEAVHEVHAAGIVHRDLKPSNIGLAHGPIPVKLLDFGLAASVDDGFLTRITQSHQVLGSLPYIAPEQFSGARPAPAQDLWALGVVLFEMLVGRLPFDAPSTAALMHAILTAPVPPTDGFPPAIRHVLESLLHKEPAQRLASARAAADALRRVDAVALSRTLETPSLPPTRALPSSPPIPPGATGPLTPLPGVAVPIDGHDPRAFPRTAESPSRPHVPPTAESPSRPHVPPTAESPSRPAGLPPTAGARAETGPIAPGSSPLAAAATSPPGSADRTADRTTAHLARPLRWGRWLVLGLVLGALSALGAVAALRLIDDGEAAREGEAPPATTAGPPATREDAGPAGVDAGSPPDAGPADAGSPSSSAEAREETAPRRRTTMRGGRTRAATPPTMTETPTMTESSAPTMEAPTMEAPTMEPSMEATMAPSMGAGWGGEVIDEPGWSGGIIEDPE